MPSEPENPGQKRVKPQRFGERFRAVFDQAARLAKAVKADAILLLMDGPTDWKSLSELSAGQKVLVTAEHQEIVAGAAEAGLCPVVIELPDAGVYEQIQQALLECVADDLLPPGASVVAVYSGFETGNVDTVSVIELGEHLRRLTGRDLRQLETRVPLDTLKLVVDLAVEIGREGREGKPVGTLFVVGDTRKVLALSHPTGFDPVRGYSRKERRLDDPRVREGIKEIAQMDGAIIVSADAIVEAAARYLDAPAKGLTLSKGLGARHWAAASVSRSTKALAVAVSETSGTVRIFQNGEVMLRIEPFRRPLKWRDFELEKPASE